MSFVEGHGCLGCPRIGCQTVQTSNLCIDRSFYAASNFSIALQVTDHYNNIGSFQMRTILGSPEIYIPPEMVSN